MIMTSHFPNVPLTFLISCDMQERLLGVIYVLESSPHFLTVRGPDTRWHQSALCRFFSQGFPLYIITVLSRNKDYQLESTELLSLLERGKIIGINCMCRHLE